MQPKDTAPFRSSKECSIIKAAPRAAFIALCRLIKFSCGLSVQVLFKVAAYPYTLLHDEEGVGV